MYGTKSQAAGLEIYKYNNRGENSEPEEYDLNKRTAGTMQTKNMIDQSVFKTS